MSWTPRPDPSQTLGVPPKRDPISGTGSVPRRRRLRICAEKNGWSFTYRNGEYRFVKDAYVMDVRLWGDLITSGTLFRDDYSRGVRVKGERVWDVLRGSVCICPPFTNDEWAKGKDAIELSNCPIHGEAA